ncbi:MAG: hypothetical protein HY314_14770, partial [Acidobacteria bacterium]|nr:hypothetical protein [Acidobacteriota bacterium]
MRFFPRSILSALALVLLASLIPGAQSQAQTVYVNRCTAGSGDGSPSNPYNTLTRAVDLAPPGSTLVVQGGSYPERLTIGQLSNQKNLTITAQRGPALIGGYFVGIQENICVPVTRREGTPFDPNSPANCAGNPPGARAKLYYPAAAPGDAPVACGGPFPLIVYAHARRFIDYPLCDWSQPGPPVDQDYRQLDGILTRLAAAGIIVVSVDVSWSGDALTERSFMVDALAYARDENARPGSRLQGAVNLVRVGLMGHSTGGEAAIRAAACLNGRCPPELRLADVRVSAVALLAPGFEADDPHESLDVMGMNAPVLIIYGTKDTQQVHDDPLKVYGMAGRPKHLVIVTGANHYGYTDGICIGGGGGG